MTTESYDKLVISPGAAPIRPPLPGIDLPGIFAVRTVPDAAQIRAWIEERRGQASGMDSYTGSRRAGGRCARSSSAGASSASRRPRTWWGSTSRSRCCSAATRSCRRSTGDGALRGASPRQARRARPAGLRGVRVREADDGSLEVLTGSGEPHPADIVILGIGVRPETALAEMAGVEVGELGGIRVDDQMRTSDPDIFAVGDAVEKKDCMTGEWALVALAGPANRQGRIAADVIAGRDSRFRGTQGTAILGAFGGAVAWTGMNEKTLKRLGDEDYEKVYLFPNSHAGYYPGASLLAMKIIFRKSDGRLLGAQAVGREGVDKRIDVLAMAIQMGGTVYDLEEMRAQLRAAVRRRQVARQLRGHGRRRRPARRHAHHALGRPRTAACCSTCAILTSSPSSRCRGSSTSPRRSSARAWTNCRAIARSSSSAARDSGPTTHADPQAERLRRPGRRRRHAVARDLRDALT